MKREQYNNGANSISVDLGAIAYSPYKITGAGAIPVTHRTVRIETDSADAFTLADGIVDGQLITISLIIYVGDATITPASLSGGTTITMDAVGDSVTLEWIQELDSGDGLWMVVGNVGSVIA